MKTEIVAKIDQLDRREENMEGEKVEQRSLRNSLEEVIFKEMISWRPRMKTRRVKEGDLNSKLFHSLVRNQRSKSRIVN